MAQSSCEGVNQFRKFTDGRIMDLFLGRIVQAVGMENGCETGRGL